MKKFFLPLGIMTLIFFSACVKEIKNNTQPEMPEATAGSAAGMRVAEAEGGSAVANEIIIKFKEGSSQTGIANAIARIGGNIQEHILTRTMTRMGDQQGLYLVHVPQGIAIALDKSKALAEVDYAEPNFVFSHDATSNDPYFTGGSLWGMSGGYGCRASTAWGKDQTGSSSVAVGIIDEGIYYQHPDLAANIWTNPGEIAGDGIDNDGNGYVDDIHGYDFANNDGDVYDAGADNHGTHVSGTIGGIGNNGVGVAGVNWNITMISAKFLGPNGGTLANAVKAVDYITDLKTRKGLNIIATNNSWGGGGYSQALYDAIDRANKANILFVAAAGNGNAAGIGINTDRSPSYPASYSNTNIIAVAAIDKNGALATWSNYGKTSVDLGAPGVGILSTIPAGYGTMSGTSMATPHVTGACALYASLHAGATAGQIKSAILNNTIATSSLKSKCTTSGRLDVSKF